MTSFVFPGQGSQFVGMSKDFYDNFKNKISKNYDSIKLIYFIRKKIYIMLKNYKSFYRFISRKQIINICHNL